MKLFFDYRRFAISLCICLIATGCATSDEMSPRCVATNWSGIPRGSPEPDGLPDLTAEQVKSIRQMERDLSGMIERNAKLCTEHERILADVKRRPESDPTLKRYVERLQSIDFILTKSEFDLNDGPRRLLVGDIVVPAPPENSTNRPSLRQ